jgi:hypothetical protein
MPPFLLQMAGHRHWSASVHWPGKWCVDLLLVLNAVVLFAGWPMCVVLWKASKAQIVKEKKNRLGGVQDGADTQGWWICAFTGLVRDWYILIFTGCYLSLWRFIRKVKIGLPYHPAISLLDIYLKEYKSTYKRDTCTLTFVSMVNNSQVVESV